MPFELISLAALGERLAPGESANCHTDENQNKHVDPPGCLLSFVDHPVPEYREKGCVRVGIVMEHRFAFYFWIKFKQDLLSRRRLGTGEEDFSPPDLISMDWHDDFGCPGDTIESQLERLNEKDEQEVALFCWASLRSLNDGHILPALWLNAVGRVYIVQRQYTDLEERSGEYKDRFGGVHLVYFFNSPQRMIRRCGATNSAAGVIWDVDMDYFTENQEEDRDPVVWTGRKIKAHLSPQREWMQPILADLHAITIALEPEYTGGLSRSLEIFRHWETALFDTPLFTRECHWKQDLLDS